MPEGRLKVAAAAGPHMDTRSERNWHILNELAKVAQEVGRTPAEVAVNWVANRPAVGSVLLGASKLHQIQSTVTSLNVTLPEELRTRLNEVSAPPRTVPCTFMTSLRAPDEPPAASVGDVAHLLDIDVQQIPGGIAFIAAHRLAGRAVQVREPVDPAPNQDLMHRRGCEPDPIGDCDRTQALLPAQVHDRAHHWRRGRPRTVVRAAGAVEHTGRSLGLKAAGPALGRRPGHLETFGGPGNRPAVLDDLTRKLQSGARSQRRVKV